MALVFLLCLLQPTVVPELGIGHGLHLASDVRLDLLDQTAFRWHDRAPQKHTSVAYFTLQRSTVLQVLPEARVLPSGEKATLFTSARSPLRVRSSCPLTTSHSFTVS